MAVSRIRSGALAPGVALFGLRFTRLSSSLCYRSGRTITLALRQRIGHNYVFVVAAVVFLALMVSAGLRATPSVLILPLETAFGWDRASISLAAAVGIFLYGLIGAFGAALILRFGIRRTVLWALALIGESSAASALMTRRWELVMCWGALPGLSTGCVAVVLLATIVNRGFVKHRGV